MVPRESSFVPERCHRVTLSVPTMHQVLSGPPTPVVVDGLYPSPTFYGLSSPPTGLNIKSYSGDHRPPHLTRLTRESLYGFLSRSSRGTSVSLSTSISPSTFLQRTPSQEGCHSVSSSSFVVDEQPPTPPRYSGIHVLFPRTPTPPPFTKEVLPSLVLTPPFCLPDKDGPR